MEDQGLCNIRVYITVNHTVDVLSFRPVRRRKWVDGRSPDCDSVAIIHRQANQASKSGTMELSKSRVGIKAALTGHCNPIEMFTLHLSKGNRCGVEEVRRKGCPVAFDIKLWKVRRVCVCVYSL